MRAALALLLTSGFALAQEPVFEVLPTGGDHLLLANCMLDSGLGFVAGGDEEGGPATLLRTTDGGRTWQAVDAPATARLYSLAFPSARRGWACGLEGTLLRSFNGGLTWRLVESVPEAEWLAGVGFADPNHGWIVGSGTRGAVLARTIDGGTSWQSLSERLPAAAQAEALRAVACPSVTDTFVCGTQGLLLRTADGGDTWEACATGTKAWLKCMSFVSRDVGFVGGSGGTLLRTDDAGASWAALPLPTSDKVNGVAFLTPMQGAVALAGEGLMWTVDGGASWRRFAVDGEFASIERGAHGGLWATRGDGRVVHIAPDAGAVDGVIQDAAAQPVAGAVVFACATDTGAPLAVDGRRSLVEAMMAEGDVPLLASAVSDADGRFSLLLPPGTWRLLAQSWSGQPDARQPFKDHAKELRLHGGAEVALVAGVRANARLRPWGDAALEIDVGIHGNNWNVLALSAAPPHTAAILGFAAWGGEFGRQLLGGGRMTAGKTLVRGLPAGAVHAAAFQNDNAPSFGTASFAAEAGATRRVQVDMKGHTLPESLAALDRSLAGVEIEPLLRAAGAAMPAQGSDGMWGFFGRVLEIADRRVPLPDGSDARCADLLAVWFYRQQKR